MESSGSCEEATEKEGSEQVELASTAGAFGLGNTQERSKIVATKRKRKVPNTVNKPTNELVNLWASPYEYRPPCVFFQYPDYVGEKRIVGVISERLREDMKSAAPAFRIAESTNIYNSVVNSFKRAGVRLVESEAWNVLWTGGVRAEQLREANRY